MDENTNVSKALKEPYEAYLAKTYGFASEFFAVRHDSDPDYKAATSGIASFGFTLSKAKNLGDLLDTAGETWYDYSEAMPSACDTSDDWAVGYDRDHNPFVMYSDVRSDTSRCDAHDVSLNSWNASVKSGTIPNYAFIAPNVWNDAHNGTLLQADRWLQRFLSPLVNDSWFSSTAFVITYDESNTGDNSGFNGTNGGHVYAVVVSPYSKGLTSAHRYNTWDVLTTTEWLLGLGRTGNNDSWTTNPPMKDLFQFSASAPTYAVSGYVLNASSGAAVEGAQVYANATSPPTQDHVATATDGSYAFALANGSYTLTAVASGYDPGAKTIDVAGAALAGVNLSLAPATSSSGPTIYSHTAFALSATASGTSQSFASEPGDTIVVLVALHGQQTAKSVTDSAGDPFTALGYGASGTAAGLSIWAAENVVGGSAVKVSFTASSASYTYVVLVIDVTHVGASPLRGSPSFADNSGSKSATESVSVAGSELVLGAVSTRGGVTFTATGSAAILDQEEALLTNYDTSGADLCNTTTNAGSIALGASLSASEPWVEGLLLLSN